MRIKTYKTSPEFRKEYGDFGWLWNEYKFNDDERWRRIGVSFRWGDRVVSLMWRKAK